MKPSDFQKTIQCQFDCKLKKVVKGIVRNYRKELARRQAKEVSFCELPEIVVEKLIVWDDYESEYTTFDVCGTEIRGSMSILWAQKVELFSQHNICRENYFLGC